MKKRLASRILTAIALVFALAVLAAPVLRAGDYHVGATLKCQECHVMHFSQSHSYTGTPGDSGTPPAQAEMIGTEPHEKLLRQSANALCLSCHGDSAAVPDVYGANTAIYERQAGALNEDGVAVDSYEDWMGHSLGSTDDPPRHTGSWSPDATDGFLCIDCHMAHGTPEQYRNLDTSVGDVIDDSLDVTYAKLSNVLTQDVFLRHHYGDGHTEAYTVRYAVGVMDLNEPTPSTSSALGAWCAGCHGNFHGASTDGHMYGTDGWLLHPTADANISAISASPYLPYSGITAANRVQVMDPAGTWASVDGDETPTCITCHRSHGSTRPFGLIYASGAAALDENGDGSQLRDLCKQCHTQ